MTQPIAPLDLSFLLNESRDCPQHVAALLVFENPDAASGWTVADLVRRYRSATPVAPFNCIPEFQLLGRPRWIPAQDMDMRYHVQHLALPSPGSEAELDELVQQWHSELLDRHRPMFHLIVVEGLAGNRFAIYAKVHHSMVDGASAIMRLLWSLSDDRKAPLQPPVFAVDVGAKRRKRVPAGIVKNLSSSVDVLTRQAVAAGELSAEFLTKLLTRTVGAPPEGSLPFGAPMTPINVPVRFGRAFAHLSLPAAPLRAAAKAQGGTLNDAVLAMVDDAVSRYLAQRGFAVQQPLHALVPVSLREENASDAGTMVSGAICPLGDPGTDVKTRLAQTIERMNAAKDRIRRFSKTAAADYFVGLYFVAQGLGAAGVRRPIANFVVSNVPGSPVEMYLGGARLLGAYPMNVLAVGLGLSVTLVSRAGELDLGFTSNRSALPDPGRIARLCNDAFEALQRPAVVAAAAKPKRRSPPRAGARSAQAAPGAPTTATPAKQPRRRKSDSKGA